MSEGEKLNEEPLTLAETKALLEKIKKRDEELSFRTGRTYEYLTSIDITTEKKAQDLKKQISELDIPRLKAEHVAKLVDIMPNTLDELKVILQSVTITNDNLKKIEGLLANAN